MLVLSRHASETIRIGDDIVVSIQRISGNRVIIGIDAPQEVAIRRGELAFDGDSPAPAEASQPAADRLPRAKTPSPSPSPNGSPHGSHANSGKRSPGLAGRTRAHDRRPLIVPLADRAAEWSASHIS